MSWADQTSSTSLSTGAVEGAASAGDPATLAVGGRVGNDGVSLDDVDVVAFNDDPVA